VVSDGRRISLTLFIGAREEVGADEIPFAVEGRENPGKQHPPGEEVPAGVV